MTGRRAAYETLLSIIEDGAYANLALKNAVDRVATGDVAALYATVYTALEHRAYLEYVLSHYCKRQKKAVRTVLLLGATELLYLHTPSHAAINEAVSLCRSIGKSPSAGVVNAVLRRLDRERDALPPLPSDPVDRLMIQYGYPEWVVREWTDAYGYEQAEAMMKTRPTRMQIRAQYPLATEELLLRYPGSERGKLDPNCLYLSEGIHLEQDDFWKAGRISVQNEGAMLICRGLGNVRGLRVLDACAAPGGKSAYLASLSENDVRLVAWELHPHRKELMDAAFRRLHVPAETDCRDATVFYPDMVDAFDAVLLDVPCTGLGLLGDKPDLRYRKAESDRDAIVAVQKNILEVCSRYVKPKGTLVYATCTISRDENERQTASFLQAHPDFVLLTERQYLPQTDGIDGFYYAAMKRGIE